VRRVACLLFVSVAAAGAGDSVRAGVFSLFRPQRLVVKPAGASVLRVEIEGRLHFVEGAQAVSFRREGEAFDCFLRRELTTARRARISARDGGATEFTLSVPGRIARRFRGALEVASRAGALEPIVTLDLETAVAAVVEAESPAGAPLEARKAQAVVSRSYYLASRGRHVDYDFCDTTHCQFLRGPAADESPASQTAGLVLMHATGVVGALFSAACGGRTSSAAAVGLPGTGYPFYAVDCDACRRGAAEWTVRFSGNDAARLRERPRWEPVRLEIVRRLGWKALPGNHYEISPDGGGVLLRGRGAGHGVGLCQQGAAAMARAGADFRAILNYYFPATTIVRR
jgi:stage II sporulation protein D